MVFGQTRLSVAALAVGALLLHASVAATLTTKPIVHTVIIEGVAFAPASLTVHRGEVIVWINKDPFPHTVTAQGGDFDSHSIAAGTSWRFTARRKGEFPYLCTLHPTMKGVVMVE